MTPGAIGRRYGRALFELAAESGSTDDVATGLDQLGQAIASLDSGALAPGSLSPALQQKLGATLGALLGAETILGRFVGVLAANDRLDQLPAIQRSFEKMRDAAAGQVRIQIRSASPLSDSDRAVLRTKFEKITGRKVLDTVEVDPNLLGGVTVEAEGRVYDGSIRTQLALLERRMAG